MPGRRAACVLSSRRPGWKFMVVSPALAPPESRLGCFAVTDHDVDIWMDLDPTIRPPDPYPTTPARTAYRTHTPRPARTHARRTQTHPWTSHLASRGVWKVSTPDMAHGVRGLDEASRRVDVAFLLRGYGIAVQACFVCVRPDRCCANILELSSTVHQT